MRVIKEGKLRIGDLRGWCEDCRCEVECSPSEAGVTRERHGYDARYYVECPTVGCRLAIQLTPVRCEKCSQFLALGHVCPPQREDSRVVYLEARPMQLNPTTVLDASRSEEGDEE